MVISTWVHIQKNCYKIPSVNAVNGYIYINENWISDIFYFLYTLALVCCVKDTCFSRASAKLLADTFLLFGGVWILDIFVVLPPSYHYFKV